MNQPGLRKDELETPVLCLDLDAYERNTARMLRVIRDECGLAWRPHMKGQKAPQLAQRAVAAGAIGVTCATVYEAEAMVEAGIMEILIANQVAGERKLRRLAGLEWKSRVMAATDSHEHARLLSAAAVAERVTIPVVIEINVGMNRCGISPGEPVVELARAIAALPGLSFAGVMGWEGHILSIDPAEKEARGAESMALLAKSAAMCREAGLPPGIVSAAGTGTFLSSARHAGLTEVQAGGGVFSDLKYRAWGLAGHEFALTVLTRVVSRPSPTRVLTDGGFKTLSSQHGMPEAIGLKVKNLALSAEHGNIELDTADDSLRVGDLVEFVPGYTDSTVCLHDEICAMRNGVVEEVWTIPGRGGRR